METGLGGAAFTSEGTGRAGSWVAEVGASVPTGQASPTQLLAAPLLGCTPAGGRLLPAMAFCLHLHHGQCTHNSALGTSHTVGIAAAGSTLYM